MSLSRCRAEDYRTVARCVLGSLPEYLEARMGKHAPVQRMADGGAYVKVVVFIPEDLVVAEARHGAGMEEPGG